MIGDTRQMIEKFGKWTRMGWNATGTEYKSSSHHTDAGNCWWRRRYPNHSRRNPSKNRHNHFATILAGTVAAAAGILLVLGLIVWAALVIYGRFALDVWPQ